MFLSIIIIILHCKREVITRSFSLSILMRRADGGGERYLKHMYKYAEKCTRTHKLQ
jgi:hypothetical protein